MKKIITMVLLAFFAVSFTIAQNAPKQVLNEKDVDAFIVNYHELQAELNTLNEKYDYIFDTFGNEEDDEIDDSVTNLRELQSIKIPEEIQTIFIKHGLGSNGFEKMIVISYAYQAIEMKEQIALLQIQFKDNSEMQSYLDILNEENTSLSASLHKNDMTLIKARLEDLRNVFFDFE